MVEEDVKKALAFIKANASKVPATSRTGHGRVIPEEIVKELENQIEQNNGAFAIDAKKLNALFGWKDTKYNKNYQLKKMLNIQYPQDEGYEWHVGAIEKGTLYKFEIIEVKTKENQD